MRPPNPVRVLIVDDSPFIRMTLKKILEADPGIEVLDTARDGREGILKLQRYKPDVITMDVEMPELNGLQALEEIMRWQPTPVVILSAVTTDGARLTMRALELGAVEVVAKPSGKAGNDLISLAGDLKSKIKTASGIDMNRMPKAGNPYASLTDAAVKAELPRDEVESPGRSSHYKEPAFLKDNNKVPLHKIEIVGICTSTGGPSALQKVLKELPQDFPVPVTVVQHMPAGFTESLASRLNSICKIKVKEVEDEEVLRPGVVYIGVAGKQFEVQNKAGRLVASILSEAPINTLYRPSADVMFRSLAKEVGKGVLGVVMTGMGSDGRKGIEDIKNKGAFSIAESEKTCIVYGMPKSVIDAGLADRVEHLPEIGRTIVQCVNRR